MYFIGKILFFFYFFLAVVVLEKNGWFRVENESFTGNQSEQSSFDSTCTILLFRIKQFFSLKLSYKSLDKKKIFLLNFEQQKG